MNTYAVISQAGPRERNLRHWHADDAQHAQEQHEEAFPEEAFLEAYETETARMRDERDRAAAALADHPNADRVELERARARKGE